MATAKAKKQENNTEEVNEYMSKLEHPFKAEIEAVRDIILNANPKVAERIKWNAPSFFYKDDIAAFHPREQKHVHLVMVFPKGLVNDTSGLLQGDYKDRRMAYFYDMADVEAKKPVLEKVINDWVALMDKE
jgi:hypothetical protein